MYHLSVPILLLHIWFPVFIGEMVPNSFLVEDKGILSAVPEGRSSSRAVICTTIEHLSPAVSMPEHYEDTPEEG